MEPTRASADVLGREALFPLAKGQPVLNRGLSAPGSGTGLASKIPDGMRAVALRSNEVVGVAGFLIPGSHLDVLVTYQLQHICPEPAYCHRPAEFHSSSRWVTRSTRTRRANLPTSRSLPCCSRRRSRSAQSWRARWARSTSSCATAMTPAVRRARRILALTARGRSNSCAARNRSCVPLRGLRRWHRSGASRRLKPFWAADQATQGKAEAKRDELSGHKNSWLNAFVQPHTR